MNRVEIIVCNDFTITPGARWKKYGSYSGEEFFDELLEPKYKQAKKTCSKLFVYLDNVIGYLSSFLDQSFGELAQEVKNILILKSED